MWLTLTENALGFHGQDWEGTASHPRHERTHDEVMWRILSSDAHDRFFSGVESDKSNVTSRRLESFERQAASKYATCNVPGVFWSNWILHHMHVNDQDICHICMPPCSKWFPQRILFIFLLPAIPRWATLPYKSPWNSAQADPGSLSTSCTSIQTGLALLMPCFCANSIALLQLRHVKASNKTCEWPGLLRSQGRRFELLLVVHSEFQMYGSRLHFEVMRTKHIATRFSLKECKSFTSAVLYLGLLCLKHCIWSTVLAVFT